MKIEITEGCISSGVDIDDKPIDEVDQQELLNYLLSKIPEKIKGNEMQIRDIISLFQYDDSKRSHHCDQCNDDVYITTYNI